MSITLEAKCDHENICTRRRRLNRELKISSLLPCGGAHVVPSPQIVINPRASASSTLPQHSSPTMTSTSSSTFAQRKQTTNDPPAFIPRHLSKCSTDTVPDSLWFAGDLQLGAGVVIIQPSTDLMVLLSEERTWINPDPKNKDKKEVKWTSWFLPKGRKDVGESLEETAVREGFEEVKYFKTIIARLVRAKLTFLFGRVDTDALSSPSTSQPTHPHPTARASQTPNRSTSQHNTILPASTQEPNT